MSTVQLSDGEGRVDGAVEPVGRGSGWAEPSSEGVSSMV